MTIGFTGGWTSKAGLLVQDAGTTKPKSQSVKVRQMLDLVGNDPNALNKTKMDQLKIFKNVKGFDPVNVSAAQLGGISNFLLSNGLISDVTALTLSNAGDKFDRFGIQSDPEAKFNALEYFATQLDGIQQNSLNGNKYGAFLIPEYKKAIYVLQNLKTYGMGNGSTAPTDKGVSSKV